MNTDEASQRRALCAAAAEARMRGEKNPVQVTINPTSTSHTTFPPLQSPHSTPTPLRSSVSRKRSHETCDSIATEALLESHPLIPTTADPDIVEIVQLPLAQPEDEDNHNEEEVVAIIPASKRTKISAATKIYTPDVDTEMMSFSAPASPSSASRSSARSSAAAAAAALPPSTSIHSPISIDDDDNGRMIDDDDAVRILTPTPRPNSDSNSDSIPTQRRPLQLESKRPFSLSATASAFVPSTSSSASRRSKSKSKAKADDPSFTNDPLSMDDASTVATSSSTSSSANTTEWKNPFDLSPELNVKLKSAMTRLGQVENNGFGWMEFHCLPSSKQPQTSNASRSIAAIASSSSRSNIVTLSTLTTASSSSSSHRPSSSPVELSSFLSNYPPSTSPTLAWLVCRVPHNPRSSPLQPRAAKVCDENEASLLMLQMEWEEGIVKTAGKIKELAVKYNYLSGKWLIRTSRKYVDVNWKRITQAMISGLLNVRTAKVSTPNPASPDPTHMMCIYTDDFTDLRDVGYVRSQLKHLGFTGKLHYKADIYTHLDVYSGNQWKIKPTIYTE